MTNQHKRALLLRVDVNVQKNVTKKQPPSFVVNFFDDFDFAVDGRRPDNLHRNGADDSSEKKDTWRKRMISHACYSSSSGRSSSRIVNFSSSGPRLQPTSLLRTRLKIRTMKKAKQNKILQMIGI